MGKVTALVGPSGGGKSTVTSLLLRFEKPQAGQLLLDGVDADRYQAASVRSQFALVTQEPLLFSGTVLENLRFGRPEATLEEVEAAARVANADGFIRSLPQGYDTRIGERGVILSGGQRQRLCIARAVLSRAPVLVLDEATSSLDPENEREVQAALAEVLPGRTALVIAHRLSDGDGSGRHPRGGGGAHRRERHARGAARRREAATRHCGACRPRGPSGGRHEARRRWWARRSGRCSGSCCCYWVRGLLRLRGRVGGLRWCLRGTGVQEWPRGAFHVHTTRSDGSGTVEEVAAAAQAAGLQFVVLTDHNDFAPREPGLHATAC